MSRVLVVHGGFLIFFLVFRVTEYACQIIKLPDTFIEFWKEMKK